MQGGVGVLLACIHVYLRACVRGGAFAGNPAGQRLASTRWASVGGVGVDRRTARPRKAETSQHSAASCCGVSVDSPISVRHRRNTHIRALRCRRYHPVLQKKCSRSQLAYRATPQRAQVLPPERAPT